MKKIIENNSFLTDQIITYLGNKRSLLNFIESGINIAKNELNKKKLSCVDIFSGSGIVARFLKAHSNFLVANDLELYSKIINECYLTNVNLELQKDIDINFKILNKNIKENLQPGFISELYAPKNDDFIKKSERVFYTKYNANFIDTARREISKIPNDIQKFFLAPLLYLASNHTNTSGVFKGFYKDKNGIGKFGGSGQNALKRICHKMELIKPIFSNFSCDFNVYQKDANTLAKELDSFDICYIDPPYNQHPYGSNYFMLNLIASYQRPQEISEISGIPKNWNRSDYNKKAVAKEVFCDLIEHLKAKFILVSYNNEGIISKDEFIGTLKKFGKVKILEQEYNTFRGSRNLNSRDIYVKENLYILRKNI
ncbi:DNA adenine methylase [Campylobacter sp. RM12327]|uniref:DNA adenine methylase n=1 Tax=Campylobacter sputorum TaxID=206 RepID=UPI000B784086|nr:MULTISPECIES: DNA adenine methylase [Campylobacter]ASM40466.1 adenine-specific DNA methyltransferase (EcoRI methylase) [Campylobacter sputorum]MBE7357259.1 DNA adenine methylase [Campylobacter sp. RM11302]MBF6668569.1 DNA adenine methylase [Campylobacter sp. RM12327]MBF6674176.1 DNA adenine methylase [Campylobacter sp. RM13538]MBF6675645.1 DNA adenine methylase [Campylobacter sp. RM12321]